MIAGSFDVEPAHRQARDLIGARAPWLPGLPCGTLTTLPTTSQPSSFHQPLGDRQSESYFNSTCKFSTMPPKTRGKRAAASPPDDSNPPDTKKAKGKGKGKGKVKAEPIEDDDAIASEPEQDPPKEEVFKEAQLASSATQVPLDEECSLTSYHVYIDATASFMMPHSIKPMLATITTSSTRFK